MEKQPVHARKFGLLACEHAFCLGCIRGWRGTNDTAGPTTDMARAISAFALEVCGLLDARKAMLMHSTLRQCSTAAVIYGSHQRSLGISRRVSATNSIS